MDRIKVSPADYTQPAPLCERSNQRTERGGNDKQGQGWTRWCPALSLLAGSSRLGHGVFTDRKQLLIAVQGGLDAVRQDHDWIGVPEVHVCDDRQVGEPAFLSNDLTQCIIILAMLLLRDRTARTTEQNTAQMLKDSSGCKAS